MRRAEMDEEIFGSQNSSLEAPYINVISYLSSLFILKVFILVIGFGIPGLRYLWQLLNLQRLK